MWLVIYHGLPSKARLAKRRTFDGLCPACHFSEMLNRITCSGIVNVGSDDGITFRINLYLKSFSRGGCIDGQIGQLSFVIVAIWFAPLSFISGTVQGSLLYLPFVTSIIGLFFIMRSVLCLLFVPCGGMRYVCSCWPNIFCLLKMLSL